MAASGVTDVHVHIQPWEMLRPAVRKSLETSRPDGPLIRRMIEDPAVLLEHLDREGVARVGLINYVSPEVMGFTSEVNEFVARYAKAAPDRLIPFGSVHPGHVRDADAEIRRLLDDLGIRAIKIHPPHQLFFPNDYGPRGLPGLRAIYERCQERRVPIMFHTGTSIFPGAKNKYGDPIHLDDVAVDFPELPIILAHGGRPLWSETAFFLLRRFPNVWFDVSGIPPRRLLESFPRLEEIAGKTMFGTDWPSPGVKSIGENLRQIRELPIPEAAREAILGGTAAKLFGPVAPR